MKRLAKDYWFIFLCGAVVGVFFLFSLIIAFAPHIDQKQRGFTPCTYQMAEAFQMTENLGLWQTAAIINKGYACYAGVMWQGWKAYVHREQKTPWENYMFEPELEAIPFEEDGEPYPADLLKENMLDESELNTNLLQDDIKENVDEEK